MYRVGVLEEGHRQRLTGTLRWSVVGNQIFATDRKAFRTLMVPIKGPMTGIGITWKQEVSVEAARATAKRWAHHGCYHLAWYETEDGFELQRDEGDGIAGHDTRRVAT